MPTCESLRGQIIGMGNWITCITGRIGRVDRMLCESGVRLQLLLFLPAGGGGCDVVERRREIWEERESRKEGGEGKRGIG